MSQNRGSGRGTKKAIHILKKTWNFIWNDNSVWSWIVNIILAFILIRFVVYPGLGLVFGTTHPIVAVVSGSMEHDGTFEDWWDIQDSYYMDNYYVTKEAFETFDFRNGFNKGDIMILFGTDPSKIEKGDVIVFHGSRAEPIIHRVVVKEKINNTYVFQTKGDHNLGQINDDLNIGEERLVGKAVLRVPFLGWVKIIFVDLIKSIGGMI